MRITASLRLMPWICLIGNEASQLRIIAHAQFRSESKMADVDQWIDIAKQCKYLPENDLKVSSIDKNVLAYSWHVKIFFTIGYILVFLLVETLWLRLRIAAWRIKCSTGFHASYCLWRHSWTGILTYLFNMEIFRIFVSIKGGASVCLWNTIFEDSTHQKFCNTLALQCRDSLLTLGTFLFSSLVNIYCFDDIRFKKTRRDGNFSRTLSRFFIMSLLCWCKYILLILLIWLN